MIMLKQSPQTDKPKPKTKKSNPRLTRRQKEFLDAINEEGRYRFDHAMYKAGVKQWLFERWMGDPLFLRQLHRRLLGLEMNHRMFLTYSQPIAADRLLTLMYYNKGDVVQKACANLLQMLKHTRQVHAQYLKDQTPSIDPAPEPTFVDDQIDYNGADEEFIKKYEHRRSPKIPNSQDYF